jgi:hypothetical protein
MLRWLSSGFPSTDKQEGPSLSGYPYGTLCGCRNITLWQMVIPLMIQSWYRLTNKKSLVCYQAEGTYELATHTMEKRNADSKNGRSKARQVLLVCY